MCVSCLSFLQGSRKARHLWTLSVAVAHASFSAGWSEGRLAQTSWASVFLLVIDPGTLSLPICSYQVAQNYFPSVVCLEGAGEAGQTWSQTLWELLLVPPGWLAVPEPPLSLRSLRIPAGVLFICCEMRPCDRDSCGPCRGTRCLRGSNQQVRAALGLWSASRGRCPGLH